MSMSIDPESDGSPSPTNTTRRPYVCPPLWVHRPSVPQHWDLAASGDKHLDISEEDGYVLSTNGEGFTPGAIVPCEPLSAVRRARPGRLRINKPWMLHRRRVSGITTSSPTSHHHQSPSSAFRIYDRLLPPTPATPNTDFKNLFNSLRQRDALALAHPAAKPSPPHEAPSSSHPPSLTRTPPSPRQQRPVLYVQTSPPVPVGTSAPPSTPALPSPCPSAAPFRSSSGRLPKRSPLPVWPAEHYPRAVVV